MNDLEDHGLERRLAALLEQRAGLAPDAARVEAAAQRGPPARRRRHRRAGAGAVIGLVGLVAVSVPFAGDLARTVLPFAPAPSLPSSPSLPSPQPGAGSTAQPPAQPVPLIPWTVPEDGATVATMDVPSAVAWSQADADAFFAAGYSYGDAMVLAALWQHPGDPSYAKVTGGAQLRGGGQLPLAAGDGDSQIAARDAALETFICAGLGVQDALKLAEL